MADQQFLASFGVDIDESGVSRLQTILTENKTLAESLSSAFDAASESVKAFREEVATDLPTLFSGSGYGDAAVFPRRGSQHMPGSSSHIVITKLACYNDFLENLFGRWKSLFFITGNTHGDLIGFSVSVTGYDRQRMMASVRMRQNG